MENSNFPIQQGKIILLDDITQNCTETNTENGESVILESKRDAFIAILFALQLIGKKVNYSLGYWTDSNSGKTYLVAEDLQISPEEFLDSFSGKREQLIKVLNFAYEGSKPNSGYKIDLFDKSTFEFAPRNVNTPYHRDGVIVVKDYNQIKLIEQANKIFRKRIEINIFGLIFEEITGGTCEIIQNSKVEENQVLKLFLRDTTIISDNKSPELDFWLHEAHVNTKLSLKTPLNPDLFNSYRYIDFSNHCAFQPSDRLPIEVCANMYYRKNLDDGSITAYKIEVLDYIYVPSLEDYSKKGLLPL